MDRRGHHYANSQKKAGCIPINDSTRYAAKAFLSYFTGFFKGLILLPFVFVVHVASVTFFNVLAFCVWIDHGFATVRYTRLFGPVLKCLMFILVPFLALLYFVLSIVAVLIASPCFALLNPGYVTLQLKMQTAWRNAYFWAGWSETLGDTVRHARQYYYFVTVGCKEAMRTVRRKAWPKRYELYPVRLCLAAIVVALGVAIGAAVDLLIYLIKGPIILIRAFKNHIDDAHIWFRKSNITMGVFYFPWFIFIIFGYLLLIPVVLLYAMRSAFEAGGLTYEKLPGIFDGINHIYLSIRTVDDETSRYIMRQDVPYEKKRTTVPFSPIWALAATLPILCGIVVVPLLNLIIFATNYFSVVRVGIEKCVNELQHKRQSLSASKIFGLYALMFVSPFFSFFWLLYHFCGSVLLTGYSGYVVHRKRSIRLGFHHMCAICYMFEYRINKFTVATSPEDQVHWVSILPNLWAYWSMPYMDPLEFTNTGVPTEEIAYVGKPPRYIPPGLRRPRIDESTGEIIDMSGPAYDIPSIGITRVGLGGSLTPPLHHVQVGPSNQRGFYTTSNSIVTIFKYLFSSDDASIAFSSTFLPSHSYKPIHVLRGKGKQPIPSNNSKKRVAEPEKSASLLSRLSYFRSANLNNRIAGPKGNSKTSRAEPLPLEITYGVELLPVAYRMAIVKAQSDLHGDSNAEWIDSSHLATRSMDAMLDGNINYPKFASIVADAVKNKAIADQVHGDALAAHNRKQHTTGAPTMDSNVSHVNVASNTAPSAQSSSNAGAIENTASASKAEEPELVPKLRDVANVATNATNTWFFCCSAFAFDGYEDDNVPQPESKPESKPEVTGKSHLDTQFEINKTTTLVPTSPQPRGNGEPGSVIFHSNAMLDGRPSVGDQSDQNSQRRINTGELPIGLRGEKLFTMDAVQGALSDHQAREKARIAERKEQITLREKQRERTERELQPYKFWESKSLAQVKSKSTPLAPTAGAPTPVSAAPPAGADSSHQSDSTMIPGQVRDNDSAITSPQQNFLPQSPQASAIASPYTHASTIGSSPSEVRYGHTMVSRRNSISKSVAGLDDALNRLRSPGSLSTPGRANLRLSPDSNLNNISINDTANDNTAKQTSDPDLIDSESEEEDFVLAPIVRPDLPDKWIELPTGDGDMYYVNYARNQSSWTKPNVV